MLPARELNSGSSSGGSQSKSVTGPGVGVSPGDWTVLSGVMVVIVDVGDSSGTSVSSVGASKEQPTRIGMINANVINFDFIWGIDRSVSVIKRVFG
jgi:hypothetical protein